MCRLDNDALLVFPLLSLLSPYICLWTHLSRPGFTAVWKWTTVGSVTDTVLCSKSQKLCSALLLPKLPPLLWQPTYQGPCSWRCFADHMLWLQNVEKSASNWPGNGLSVGYLSWYQNMLRHLLGEKDISGLPQPWTLHLVILTCQAICAVGAMAAWQVMGNVPLPDWVWGMFYHGEFHA